LALFACILALVIGNAEHRGQMPAGGDREGMLAGTFDGARAVELRTGSEDLKLAVESRQPSLPVVKTGDPSETVQEPDVQDQAIVPAGGDLREDVVTFEQSPEGRLWWWALAGESAVVEPSEPSDTLGEVDPPPALVDEPSAHAVEDEVAAASESLAVYTDYREAMKEAVEDRKMLFIYFHETRPTAAQRAFEIETLADTEIQEKLKRYVFVKLPRDAQINVDGQRITLLEHAAFAEMLSRQGVAVVDLAHARAEYYGHVVSTFPFTPGKYYLKEALSIVLDLPPGTLTQRTMIYAVRIHPERPASTQGQLNTVLADEAKQHANYQAAILVQGHHSWDARFHRINARLPSGVMAQEVVAESWPNESLVEACIDCVHSWRQSPGHWGAVRSRHPLFGYDIKRGRNGIWYATGIFGRR
jgi:hypothetical protein